MQRWKKSGFIFGCVLLAAVPVLAQDKAHKDAPEGAPGAADMEAMMADMIKYATPGEHHAHLKPMAGKWKYKTKFRQVPDMPWSEGAGESTNEWVLDGRFLVTKAKSPPSEGFPMPFEGFGLLGYDNLAKKYVSIWTDNFFTGVMHFTGDCDASGKVITVAGEYRHPMKGGELSKEKWVWRIINNDKYVFEMWQPGEDGKEFMHGEITYTRVQ